MIHKKAKQDFEKLKKNFITAPILTLFDPSRKIVLEIDCSSWAMVACLSQLDSEQRLRPVSYFSKKLSSPEYNYDIYDKELLAIVRLIEFWRAELMSLDQPIEILTDHKSYNTLCPKEISQNDRSVGKNYLIVYPVLN